MGGGRPKALRSLRGKALLVHAVERASQAKSVAMVVVAAPPGAVDEVQRLLDDDLRKTQVIVVSGGDNRQDSVARALEAVPTSLQIVLVHDAARPLTPPDLFDAVADAVRGGADAVIPVLPVTDTIKRVDDTDTVVETLDRSALRAVQTPQGFRRSVLVEAHAQSGVDVTDDAGLVEHLGRPVRTVLGRAEAMKITTPWDLAVAESIVDALP